jgi:hypothetical protein
MYINIKFLKEYIRYKTINKFAVCEKPFSLSWLYCITHTNEEIQLENAKQQKELTDIVKSL